MAEPIITPFDRETVACPVCAAASGEPCDFSPGKPRMVVENGVERRVVHAGRYAQTLPEGEAAAFWGTAVDKYFAENLAPVSSVDGTEPNRG